MIEEDSDEVGPQGAAGALARSVVLTFKPAFSAGVVVTDTGTCDANWLRCLVFPQSGKDAVVSATGADAACSQCGADADPADSLALPTGADRFDQAVASAAFDIASDPRSSDWAATPLRTTGHR